MKQERERKRRMPTFLESVIPIIAMLVILTIGKGVFGYSTEPLLIMVAAVAAFVAFRVGVTWDEMLQEISEKIAKGMPAILILICVGAMVGAWMSAGTIPMMIYYGIQIVNPKFLLVTAFLMDHGGGFRGDRHFLGFRCHHGRGADGDCRRTGRIPSGYGRRSHCRFLFRGQDVSAFRYDQPGAYRGGK